MVMGREKRLERVCRTPHTLGPHADAASENDELQIEERLQGHYGEGHQRAVVSRTDAATSSPCLEQPENVSYRGGCGSAFAPVIGQPMAGEPTSSSECAAARGDLRTWIAPDWQVGDFACRAMRPAKQLVVHEQAEPAPVPNDKNAALRSDWRTERMLAQHGEIHVVLDRDIRPEALAQKAEDIEVFQPGDVWSQGNPARVGIDRPGNATMT